MGTELRSEYLGLKKRTDGLRKALSNVKAYERRKLKAYARREAREKGRLEKKIAEVSAYDKKAAMNFKRMRVRMIAHAAQQNKLLRQKEHPTTSKAKRVKRASAFLAKRITREKSALART